MFCPNCKYEYKPGVTVCPDCGADLVYKLPPELANPPHNSEDEKELVIVYFSSDRANIPIARSLLDDAGIEYLATRDWRGGPSVVFRVHPDRAAEAKELLEGLG